MHCPHGLSQYLAGQETVRLRAIHKTSVAAPILGEAVVVYLSPYLAKQSYQASFEAMQQLGALAVTRDIACNTIKQ